ncbi:tetratricopeptide repeat protein [Erwinia sp. CPCC 100877]|nr:tetratricopeptide repeat protein [Erwinia sp. CPCC 100877]
MHRQDYTLARKTCEKVLRIMPSNMLVLSDYALTLMREGNYLKAYHVYKRIEKAPISQQQQASSTWLDGLAEVCGWLGKTTELKEYGGRSLRIADATYSQGLSWNVTDKEGHSSLNPDATKNIISFSLFGSQPKYCETIVKNVSIAKELYPGWTCRVYLDNTVPDHTWRRLITFDAQLIDMSSDKSLAQTMWRFLVMDDKTVERFIIRDADALISERESAAVKEWISSGKCFHHMRDYFTHTDLMLAGMWGGINGIFPRLYPMMQDFVRKYNGNIRFTDQAFLRKVLWPTVRKSLLSHDEIFGFHQPVSWPKHEAIRWNIDNFHVGSNISYSKIGNTSCLPDGEIQKVCLEINNQCYCYEVKVHSGRWTLEMPFFLIKDYQDGIIKIMEIDN